MKSVLQNFCQKLFFFFQLRCFWKNRLFKMPMLDSLTFEVLRNRGHDFLGFRYANNPIKYFTKEGLNSIFTISFIS